MRQKRFSSRAIKTRQPGRFLRTLALLLLTAVLVACGSQNATREGQQGEAAIADILAQPDQYFGQQLTLSGQVTAPLSSQAFRMEDARVQPFGEGPRADGLLVVIDAAAERPIDIDDEMDVQVTGELQAYDPEAIGQNIGSGFNPATHGITEGVPVLVAERVLVMATISDLDRNPGSYLHSTVTVSGRVAEVMREGIVRLEDQEGGGDVLVVIGDAAPGTLAQEGQRLVVTGRVRQFNLDELGGELDLDLDSGIFAGWENRVVIMAESIREG